MVRSICGRGRERDLVRRRRVGCGQRRDEEGAGRGEAGVGRKEGKSHAGMRRGWVREESSRVGKK